ncbi:hypothetical protein V2J09_015013 [Rumex salicifolius]
MPRSTTTLVLLRVLMALILSGWVCLWFLKPTDIWTKKWRKAETDLNKTIFRYNGLDFVVYTFPVVVVCILGQVLLYLQSKEPQNINSRKAFSSVYLIKTPLGLISAFEIIPISVFILLLAWTFYARISHDFMKLKPQKQLKLNIWQLKSLRLATRCGLLAEACLSLLLFPILRGLSLFKLLGIQFEASVRYHVWIGTSMVFFATLHGGGTLFVWGTSHQIQDQIWKWQKVGRIYLAGGITLVTGLIIWMTSLPFMRRTRFQLFYSIHHLYIIFLVFFLFHAGDRHFYMIFPGVLLFGLDKLLRIIQSNTESCILYARIFPCRTIELTLPKDPICHMKKVSSENQLCVFISGLKYMPTSIIFIKIPMVSRLQWHPFSITSSSVADEHTISVMIKCEGWWTNNLYETLHKESRLADEQTRCIPVSIEGPYGPTVMDFLRYDSLIMVAGGIGITPFLSILQHIASVKEQFPSKVELIYVAKSLQDLCLLQPISNLILNQPGRWHLKVKVFLTQEVKHSSNLRELITEFSQERRLVFGTNRSSQMTNGPETPLYMAMIVGFCSMAFIIFLCIFNHFFLIPEGDKSSDKAKKTPSTLTDLLLITAFMVSLLWCALVAIILRRRRLNRLILSSTKKQDADTQIVTPLVAFAEQHEVYFVGRPNFQDELSKCDDEFGERELGVVVCGPESMKESVALACQQSCRGKNKKPRMSFHSLNFTL